MKLNLRKSGGAPVDVGILTAGRGDVAADEKFYGAGDSSAQIGILKKNNAIAKKLGANESYTIPTGLIPKGSYVYQDIPTQGALTINPVAVGSMAGVSGKYMTADITVNGVENLKPENIKSGAFIGTVGGSWQGYVNNNQFIPYWYGVLPPGQTGYSDSAYYVNRNNISADRWGDFEDAVYSQMSVNWNYPVEDSKKGGCIRIESEYIRYAYTHLVFPYISFGNGINIPLSKSFTICYRLPPRAYNQVYSKIILSQYKPGVFYEKPIIGPVGGAIEVLSWSIGNYEEFSLQPSANEATWRTETFTIAHPDRYSFISVLPFSHPDDYTMAPFWAEIRYIKFNQ